MRLFLFLLLFSGGIALAAESHAQEALLSINVRNKSISEVLDVIEKQTDFKFFYNSKLIDTKKKVSVDSNKEGVFSILDKLFSSSSITYRVVGNDIILTEKKDTDQQSKKSKPIHIKGNVTDMNSEPLIGASVVLKDDPSVGVVTDVDGNYTISVPSQYSVLQFKYLGYIEKEEEVGKRSVINVILPEDVGQLDEVVVVGYGTQKKESVVGAIATLSPDKLAIGTTRSISNNLAGQISGVLAVQRSGEPGYDNSSFWIRGISSFQGVGNSPLVLVDGIERNINNVDAEEIESFSVLKDAAASAVYGVRGANGVILITTKRGKVGKPKITVKSEFATTRPTQLPKYLGAADYMQMIDDIMVDDGLVPMYDADRILKTRNGYDPELYPDVNWVDAITKDYASNQRVTMDISGGSEYLRYSFIAAYYNESGIIAVDPRQEWDSSLKITRYNVRSNVDLDLTPSTLLRFSIGGYLQDRNAPPKSIDWLWGEAFTIPPHVHANQYASGEIPRVMERTNPWAETTQTGYQRNSSSNIESVFSVEQDLKVITPGLKVKGTFSFDRYAGTAVKRERIPDYYYPATGRNEEGQVVTSIQSYGSPALVTSTSGEWGDKSTYLEGSLSYNRIFGELHGIDAMVLYNQRNYDKFEYLPYRHQGLAGRTSYTYDGKYIGEFNFGYNGSENFQKGHRFGFFPSFALGWIVSEEAFFSSLRNTVSKLKVRGSMGLVGNDQFEGNRRFSYLTTINEGGYYNENNQGRSGFGFGYNGSRWIGGIGEGEFGVDDLTWESVKKYNLGLELGLWNNMIDLQVDVFKERRSDIFMRRETTPASAGFVNKPWANYGKVDNKGIDVTLNVNKQINKDWFLSVLGTFTYAKNIIIEKDEAASVVGTSRAETGHPVGQYFGLVDQGLYTDDDFENISTGTLKEGLPIPQFGDIRPGDIKYADIDGDGFITPFDRTAIGGTFDPQIVYGFGVNVQYRSFSLGMLFQGTGKVYNMIGRTNYFLPGSGNGAVGNYLDNALNDRWTKDNPSQDVFYPRGYNGYHLNNSQASTWWLKNMDMLRLKNFELGYSLPTSLNRKAGLSGSRVYLRGMNILSFSKWKLWDPEVSSTNGTGYPIMKSVSVGLEFSF